MFIFNDNIKLSNKKNKENNKNWCSPLIKQSEKEPEKVIEGLIRKLDEKPKEIKDTNQVSLKEKRDNEKNSKNYTILEVSLENDNKDITLTIEDNLNESNTRNDEYYKEPTLPIYTKYVFPKNKKDALENKEYYKKHKELMQDGDVVTAKKKCIINKKSNLVEDIYIKKVDPKKPKDDEFNFDDENLKEITECKKNA